MDNGTEYRIREIGIVHTNLTQDTIRSDARDLHAIVEIHPQYQEALDGIDGFSHIFILSYFNKLRPEQIGPLKVKPRRLLHYGLKLDELPLLGVFALDSPTRPNPIGLTLVKLIRREKNQLHVEGLDLFDGTPVLDVKPYRENYQTENFEIPEWDKRLRELTGRT